MENKVLRVTSSGTKTCHIDMDDSSFFSKHKEEDITRWLEHKGIEYDLDAFEEVFGNRGEDCYDDYDAELTCFGTDIQEGDESESYLPNDEKIQRFLDGEPEHERLRKVHHLRNDLNLILEQSKTFKGTVVEKLNEFKELIDSKKLDEFTFVEKQTMSILESIFDTLDRKQSEDI